MTSPHRYLTAAHRGEVCCVRLRRGYLDEPDIRALGDELLALGSADGCRRLVLSLGGAEPPQLMYSVFLACLVALRRLLAERGRDLVLCDVGASVRAILEACKLDSHFRFAPTFDAAIALPPE